MGWLSRLTGGRTKVDAGIIEGTDRFKNIESNFQQFKTIITDNLRETTANLNKRLKNRNTMGNMLGTMSADLEQDVAKSGGGGYSAAADISSAANVARNAVETANRAAVEGGKVEDSALQNIAERTTEASIKASGNVVKALGQDQQTFLTDQKKEFSAKENKAGIARNFTGGVLGQISSDVMSNIKEAQQVNKEGTGNKNYSAVIDGKNPAYAKHIYMDKSYALSNGTIDFTQPFLSQPGNQAYTQILSSGNKTKKLVDR